MRKAKIKFLLPVLFLLVSFFSLSFAQPIKAAVEVPEEGASGIENSNSPADTAEVNINLSEKLVLDDGRSVQDAFSKPSDMVNLIVRVVFIAAGIILFALVIGAGFTLISGGDGKNLDKAKTTLTGAIAGFMIMFAAYWIMQIISMLTGANIGF